MSTTTIFYQNEDIVEASVTKSRPGQSLGLLLKEQNNEERRIYVREIVEGLFRSSQHGVQSGDELLEVNGIPVANFEHGLRDVKKFMQGEWSINIRVGRNTGSISSNQSCSMDTADNTTATIATSASSLLDNLSGHEALHSDGDQPLIDRSSLHENNGPVVPKRRGRRKSRESLGSLIRDVRSRTPSDRGSSSARPRRGKRPDSTHSRSNRSRSRSKKTHDEEKQPSNSSSHSRSNSRKSKKTKRDRKKSKDASSHKKKKEKKTNESNSSMINDNNNESNRSSHSAAPAVATDNDNQQIRGVQCSSSCVTLEMKDGKCVSVNPMDLMALMTEEDGKFVPISNRKMDTLDDRPLLEKTKATKTLAIVSDSDDSDNDDEDEHYDTVATHLKDLTSMLQNRNKITQNDCSSIDNPWARRSMSTLDEFQSTTAGGATTPTSLRKLLGERLRTTNPKKWEESSMVSSTLACMTNLIDPGDLMKIRNFHARPGLNGATVEIICKSSIGSKWNDRWDVRVIQRKNQRASDWNLGNKLVSVAAENLRHFV